MSNLKKILALVLALVMSFSLVSVSSAAFDDADEVNPTFVEAIEVLAGLKVFQGRTETEFAPKATITRAEVAAIIYRVVTGDVKGTQVGIYADYNKFDDVKSTAWYAGYVNYCANAEYIKGYGDGKFGPNDTVTGYQALAMILRAVGYDKAGEFTGSSWQVQTAKYGKTLGVTKNLTEATLGVAATREVVAEILFQTIAFVPQVTYTLLGGYDNDGNLLNNALVKNPTIGYSTFKLAYDENVLHDDWGRPYHVWYKDTRDVEKDGHATLQYDAAYESVVYAKYYTPVYSSTVAEAECDIVAKTFGKTFGVNLLTVNGNETDVAADMAWAFNGNTNIEALATKLTVGEQGRLTEIYYTVEKAIEVVMIDEFLALVVNVTDIVYDANGHVKHPAYLTMYVYDQDTTTTAGHAVTLTSYAANFTQAAGDVLLLNAKTTAFNVDVVDTAAATQLVEIVGAAPVFEGKQTAFTNRDSHIVNGTETPDNIQFHLDEAGIETSNHYWFNDSYGNLIGAMNITAQKTFGTISAIHWVNSADLTKGYALATITWIDGTQTTEKIAKIDGITLKGVITNGNYATGDVSATMQYNETYYVGGVPQTERDYTNVALYQITDSTSGKVLKKVTDLGIGASVVTGVTKMTAAAYANTNTKFLVWDGAEYTTYTGIQNVPSFQAADAAGQIWAATLSATDVAAEVVFINEADLVEAVKEHVFFLEDGDALRVETDVRYAVAYGVYYHTVTGGWVDGEKAALVFESLERDYRNDAGVQALLALMANNKLAIVETTDGIVTDVTEIGTAQSGVLGNALRKVEYEGAAKDVLSYQGNTLVVADGDSYDVTNVQWIGTQSLWHAKMDNMYLYVEYVISTVNGGYKTATYIYATKDIHTGTETVVEDLVAAVVAATNAVANAEADLAAAKTALETAGVTLTALTATQQTVVIEARAKMAAAQKALDEAMADLAKALNALNAAYAGLSAEDKAVADQAKTDAALATYRGTLLQAEVDAIVDDLNEIAPATAADKANMIKELKDELHNAIVTEGKAKGYFYGNTEVYVYDVDADVLLANNTIKVFTTDNNVDLTIAGTITIWTDAINKFVGTYKELDQLVDGYIAKMTGIATKFVAGFAPTAN